MKVYALYCSCYIMYEEDWEDLVGIYSTKELAEEAYKRFISSEGYKEVKERADDISAYVTELFVDDNKHLEDYE